MADIIFLQKHPRFFTRARDSESGAEQELYPSLGGANRPSWLNEPTYFEEGEPSEEFLNQWDVITAAYEAAQLDTRDLDPLDDWDSDIDDWARSDEEGWFYED